MANQQAPIGQIFVCSACGKRSNDKYGDNPIDHGWDESCMLHAVLCYDTKDSNGQWVAVVAKALGNR